MPKDPSILADKVQLLDDAANTISDRIKAKIGEIPDNVLLEFADSEPATSDDPDIISSTWKDGFNRSRWWETKWSKGV